jgi:hypothetical protein
VKKLITIVIGLLVLVSVAAVAYKIGWLAQLGVGSPVPVASAPGTAEPAGQNVATPGEPNVATPPAGSASAQATAGQPSASPEASGATGQAAPGIAGTPGEAASPAGAPTPASDATTSEPARAGAAAAPPIAAPPFDGNVANIAWGGRIESVTGDSNVGPTNSLITEKDTWYGTSVVPGPKDIVVSFFKREPVLIGSVTVVSLPMTQGVRDVEIWISSTGPETSFVQVASGSIARSDNPFTLPENTFRFNPVEARFVKIRLVRNHEQLESARGEFRVNRVKVIEAQAAGYVPLLTRHPEVAAPTFVAQGLAAAASQPVPASGGCAPTEEPPMRAGNGESKKVLLIENNYLGMSASYVPAAVKANRVSAQYVASRPEFGIFDRVESTYIQSNHVQPWMLTEVDTVIMEQVCDMTPLTPRFRQALTSWVAAGHKLIVHDADKCSSGPDYSWLPYRFKTSNPGAMGAKGNTFRILENSWMLHDVRGRAGFVDGAAWAKLTPPANELGDSNVITEWGPGWCGQVAVRNVLGVFGFSQAYAHYGRGLIIWEGLDVDMTGTTWLDIVRARQLAQGFNTDNLPCSVKVGSFVVVTEPRLLSRGVQPGQSYTYPLSILPNLNYKGTVKLTPSGTPTAAGLDTRIEPATIAVAGEQTASMTVTVPAGAKPGAMALEVKGTDTDGKTSSLCLQLGPPKGGELQVISTLAPPTKTRKNLEIILDASGSMKALMAGKKTRWDVALATLQQVLAELPDDFNVGLRIYGHREASTSPKTCTDSELVVPIRKLDRQAILSRASSFKPKGETPLVYSALQAPSDLKLLGGGTVILITDGEESCKGDPVKAAAELKASGLDLRLNIVGFALTNPKTQKDLAGFSQATGGLFYSAQNGDALADALLMAAVESFPYTVYNAAGKQVLAGEAGTAGDELPPGDYKVVVKAGTRELVAPRVTITLGQTTTLKIAFKNNQLVLE